MKRNKAKVISTPPVVYKYMPPDIARLFLSNNSIRATRIFDFNDPFDSASFYLDNIAKAYAADGRAKLLPELPEDQIESLGRKVVDGTMQTFNDRFGICCFSSNGASIPMWSYYSDGHKGVCIGFDGNADFFHKKRAGLALELRKIKYRKDMFRMCRYGSDWKFDKHITGTDVALRKAAQWRLESEWRMIFNLQSNELHIKHNQEGELIHLIEVPTNALKEVTIGVKANPDLKKEVINFCSKLGIKCYFAQMSRTKFAIERAHIQLS